MKRVHLFEFEDLAWFPDSVRNYVTDFLQFLTNKANMYKCIIPMLEQAVKDSGKDQIIDLASGGGGGILRLNEALKKEIPNLKITLTDYYPNLDAFRHTKSLAPNIDFYGQSVDARNVPAELSGLRTQFLSFHHFRPDDAQKILQNAIDANTPIAIFEGQERSLPSFVAMLFSPVSVLLATPFIRPFKIGRIVFTYLIPIVPLVVLWDGFVSSLRTYSVDEMNEIIGKLNGKDYFEWKIGRMKSGPGNILYLIGQPKKINYGRTKTHQSVI